MTRIGSPEILSPVIEHRGCPRLTIEAIDAALDRVMASLMALCAELADDERFVLGMLLDAVRNHPLMGDAVDERAQAKANEHIPDEVLRSRERARAIATLVLDRCTPRTAEQVPPNCGAALRDHLIHFFGSLDEVGRHQFREIMSNALGGLSPSGQVPRRGWPREAWTATMGAFAATGPSGSVFVGRAPSIDNGVHAKLVSEASAYYWLAVRMGLRMTAAPGPVARAVGADPALARLVGDAVGRGVKLGNGVTGDDNNATLLYYDEPGDGIQPHVDPYGLVNLLLMLECTAPRDADRERSHLLLYEASGQPRRIALEPSEMVVLEGAGTVHAREPVGPGEHVTILSLVYHYA